MQVLTTSRLALACLIACAVGVSGPLVRAQSSSSGSGKKSTGSSSAASTHHPTSAHHGKTTKRTSARERGQKAPTAGRISEIQTALSKDGSFGGTPNGKWDSSTVEALKKFQQGHGLSPTGKLDAKTLQKLGLGSQTAGLAAPMPPVSSSALTSGTGPAVPRK
jgi:peptidoglycan hydrolase-like protein with peptidoglycan-binding domain